MPIEDETMNILRPYLEKDKEALNRVAIEAFSQFMGHYNDWEPIKSVGNPGTVYLFRTESS